MLRMHLVAAQIQTQSICLQVGDTFVLNCLGEGQYGKLMKVRAMVYCSSMLQDKSAALHRALAEATSVVRHDKGPSLLAPGAVRKMCWDAPASGCMLCTEASYSLPLCARSTSCSASRLARTALRAWARSARATARRRCRTPSPTWSARCGSVHLLHACTLLVCGARCIILQLLHACSAWSARCRTSTHCMHA